MKVSWKVLLFGGACVILSVLSVRYGVIASGNRQIRQMSYSKDMAGDKKDCAMYALLTACSRLGVPLDATMLTESLRPDEDGVSFGRLVSTAQECSLETSLARISWDDLASLDTTAILWVDGSHFVAVDPREQSPVSSAKVRVYEASLPTEWCSKEQLERRWKGEALVLRRNDKVSRSNGPVLRCDSLLEDKGWVIPSSNDEFEYTFHNDGDEDLFVRAKKVACGCMSAQPMEIVIAPGQSEKMTLWVDHLKRRGLFRTFAYLASNDPDHGAFLVTASASVLQSSVLTHRDLHFGDIRLGESKSKRFFLVDRGNGAIGECDAAIDPETLPGDMVRVQCQEVGPGDIGTFQREYPVKEGDYAVEVTVAPGRKALLGPFAGKVLLRGEGLGKQDGFVQVKGNVVTNVVVRPAAVSLSEDQPACVLTVSDDMSSAPLVAEGISVSGNLEVTVTPLGGGVGEWKCSVSLKSGRISGFEHGVLEVSFLDERLNVPVYLIPASLQ